MENLKKDKDVTLWVSLMLAVILFFPVYGQMLTGCVKTVTPVEESADAEYWHQKYLQSQEELLLWRDIAHMYWQFRDYDYLDDKTWEPRGLHNFWDDCISETCEYDKLDSIQHGDWEDFFFDW